MNRFLKIIVFFFVIPVGLIAQQTLKMLYHPFAVQHAACFKEVDPDGFIMASNYEDSTGEKGILLTRFDDFFQIMWERTIGEPGVSESVSSFYQGLNGDLIFAGSRLDTNGISRTLLFKCDPAGNLIWSNTFQFQSYENRGVDLFQSASGSLYALCWSENEYGGFPVSGMNILKLSDNGNLQWSNFYGAGSYNAYGIRFYEYPDGNLCIGENHGSLNLNYGAFLKMDTLGQPLIKHTWTLTWWSNMHLGRLDDVCPMPVGEFAVFGNYEMDTVGAFEVRNFLITCDLTGAPKLSMKYGIYDTNYFKYLSYSKMTSTSDKGFAVAGYISGTSSGFSILKVDSLLQPEWCRYYPDNTSIVTLLQLQDQNYLWVGNSNDNILLTRTDSLGNTLCNDSAISVYAMQDTLPAFTFSGGGAPPLPLNQGSLMTASVIQAPLLPDTLCFFQLGFQEIETSVPIVSPNPAASSVIIKSDLNPIRYVQIFDTTKRLVKTVYINDKQGVIDLNDVKPGIYFLNIQMTEKLSICKIVKQ